MKKAIQHLQNTILTTLLLLFTFQMCLAQNQIFLAKKSDPITPKAITSGSFATKTVFPSVSSDKRFMAISISESSVDGSTMTFQPSSFLFNLETGKVTQKYRNVTLYFVQKTLLKTGYGDIWDKKIEAAKFMKEVYKNTSYGYINPLTLQQEEEFNLPEGHIFQEVNDEYILSFNIANPQVSETYVWRRASDGLKLSGKFPFGMGKISADGRFISGAVSDYTKQESRIIIFDLSTGDQVKEIKIKGTTVLTQITKQNHLVYSYTSTDNKTYKTTSGIKIIDIDSEEEVADFPDAGNIVMLDDKSETMLVHSLQKGQITLIDMSDFSILSKESYKFVDEDQPYSQGISAPIKVGKGEHFMIGNPSGIINLVSNKEKKIIADIYVDHEDWAVVAKDGRVDGTPGALDKLEWREYDRSGKVVNRTSLNAAFANFFTPGLLPALLRDEVGDISELREQLAKAPSLEISSPADGTKYSQQELTVNVKTSANGDPVKEIQLYVNGKLFSDSQRGLKLASNINEKSFDILLVPGKNIISAKAISQNDYESSPAYVEVEYTGRQIASNLHILAIGIDEYVNNSYNLNYAVADAGAIVDNIRNRSTGIFGQTQVYTIYNQDATKTRIMDTFRQIAESSKPDDVFVFFYAGHGVMSEGGNNDFYLALHDVTQLYGKEEMLENKGISAGELKILTSDIKAQKQMIMLDACQSGGAVETFALRGAAEEKAMIQLARSTGVTLLASTGSEQYATEFDQLGHGVFTYALLDGMSGKADGGNHDKKITVKELEAYLNDSVPELTLKYKGTTQYPRSWSQGMDFPIGIIKN